MRYNDKERWSETKKPTPRIQHIHARGIQKDLRVLLLDEAIEKLRIKSEAARLMRVYASCPSGFAPSTTFLLKKTGIKENNIARARAKLERFGLLGFQNNTIWIDWRQIQTLASLDPELMGSPSKATIGKVQPPDSNYKTDPIADLLRLPEIDITA